MSRFGKIFISILVNLTGQSAAHAAACCGGGSIAPQIVASDFRSQVNMAISLSSLTLSGAWSIPKLLDDRLQITAQLPLPYSVSSSTRGMTLGDLSAGINFELLRNWDNSSILPNTDVLAFIGVQFPTGVSIYQVSNSQALVGGTGFYRLLAGIYATRVFGDFDIQTLIAGHRSLARTFVDGSGDVLFVDPGFGAAATFGIGFSPGSGQFRFGLQATPAWEQGAILLQPGHAERGSDSWGVDFGTSIAWLADPTWTLALTYTEPVGALAHDRNLALLVQKRWWR